MSAGRHMLRVLVIAMLALASPAYAATPVSDQYQSAPPPLVGATPAAPAAPAAAAPAPGSKAAASTPAATHKSAGTPAAKPAATQAAPATPRAPAALVVEGDRRDAPLAAPDSDLPLGALAGLGLLAIALVFAAVGRTRRPATGA